MSNAEPIPTEQIDPQTLSLARMLMASPNARRSLQRSIETQQQQREAKRTPRPSALPMDCPHCGAPGITYLTLPTKDGPREFKRKPMDCCQPALRDAAENALHYALNPNNCAEERVEAADRYAALKASITPPVLLSQLEEHEAILADIEARVSGLTRAQGGVEWGPQ
ncbi:hypothetical protein [Deinococcus sp. NW-56]|uniref:hypothetical protein n=1 Tax=Deinococcus sp. NW-56 TaxID=2080419 RepID=UPI000CF3A6DF|nr:hypothetical protein [Deinococcus sp. NW-56]